MRRSIVSLIIALVFITPALAQEANDDGQAGPDRPIVVATFFSSFCGACQVLDPRINAVKSEFENRPVTFIKFDKTFSALGGRKQRTQLAEDHGMAEIWRQNKDAQGFALIVDPEAEQVLDVLTIRRSTEEIRDAIDQAMTSTI